MKHLWSLENTDYNGRTLEFFPSKFMMTSHKSQQNFSQLQPESVLSQQHNTNHLSGYVGPLNRPSEFPPFDGESRLCILSIRLSILSPWPLDFRQGFRLCLTGSRSAAEAGSVVDLEGLKYYISAKTLCTHFEGSQLRVKRLG